MHNAVKSFTLVVIKLSLFAGMKFHPVQSGQISSYDYIWKLNFIPGQFSAWSLFKFVCNFFKFFFVTILVYELENP